MTRYIRFNITDLSDEDITVRIAAARNANARVATLEQLANDPEALVRYWVLKNPNTPPEIKARLGQEYFDWDEFYFGMDIYGDYRDLWGQSGKRLDSALAQVVFDLGGVYITAEEGGYNAEDDNDIELNVKFECLYKDKYLDDIARAIANAVELRGFEIVDANFY